MVEQEKSLSRVAKIFRPLVAKGAEIFVDRTEKNIVQPIIPEFPDGFREMLLEKVKDPNTVLILISNHEGLPDGGTTAVLSRDITSLINEAKAIQEPHRGFMLTIAASLETGHQNLFIKEVIKYARYKLPKYFLTFGVYTRRKDKEKYHLKSNNNDEYNQKLTAIIDKKEEREADGLALYLAGNMEEGRRIKEGEKKGQMKGMQRLECEQFHLLIEIMKKRYHKKPILIPVGSYGAFDVLDPDRNNLPTLKSIGVFMGTKPKKSLLTVKVGLPIDYDDMVDKIQKDKEQQKITNEDIDNCMGKMIAKLLPLSARGVYA